MKNIKKIFFVVTLLTIILAISTVNAADDTNSTTDIPVVSDTASDTISTDVQTSASGEVADTRNLEKEDKNVKEESVTVDGIDYTQVHENQELNDNVFTMRLRMGRYSISENTYINNCNITGIADSPVNIIEIMNIENVNVKISNSKINTNIGISGETNLLIIENSSLNSPLDINNNATVTFKNSTINSQVNNYGVLIIDDYTTLGENFQLDGEGEVVINDSSRLPQKILSEYNGTYTISNAQINKPVTNYANLTLVNSSTSSGIYNYANLTLINSTISFLMSMDSASYVEFINSCFGQALTMDYIGIINMTNSVLNTSIRMATGTVLTLNNTTAYESITMNNNSVLTLDNAIIYDTININNATLIIAGDTVFGEESTIINKGGEIMADDFSKILPYLSQYNGNYTLENLKITKNKTNKGNLTIKNSTLNSTIYNYGILVINDDCVFGENFVIRGNGTVIVNDNNKLIPYYESYNGTYTIENMTITGDRKNYANLTIINSTILDKFENQGNLTIINSTILKKGVNNLNGNLTITDSVIETNSGYSTSNNGGTTSINNSTINGDLFNSNGELIISNSTINNQIIHSGGVLTITDSSLNSTISASDDIFISDDCIYGENLIISGRGDVVVNDTEKILPFLDTYNKDYTFVDVTLNRTKTNYATITYINSTLNATINNNGVIIINDNTLFGEKFKVTGNGDVIINDTDKIAPYISKYNGTFTLENMNINDPKTNYGNLTLNNCTITQPLTNYGNITINNCTINVAPPNPFVSSYYLTNYGTAYIREDNIIRNGRITSSGEVIYTTLPKPETYIVTNETLHDYFTNDATGNLTDLVKAGDTLDFQGKITANHSLTVNKPINIISTTQDAYVDLNTTAGSLLGESQGASFVINNGGSYSNLTGIYFHNTQLWFYNTHYVTINNISAVVEDQQVGSGVGQTSIRANSTYVTIKNSYIYTRNNGGSSSLVLAWADYCTVENCTIEGGGGNGNLLYLTTWNVYVPEGIIANSNNKLINNTVKGNGTAISWGITLSGVNNTVDGNTIYSNSAGIMMQWGGDPIMGETVSTLGNITISNNKLIGGCGIDIGNYIYNNYVEGVINSDNALIVNNTASQINVNNNTRAINNTAITMIVGENNRGTNPVIEHNNVENIYIGRYSTNVTITGNNITGQIALNGSYCNITDNNITTDNEYTITGRGKNNTITDNYLVAKTLTGDKSVQLSKDTNTIKDNIPKPNESIININPIEITAGDTATITATLVDQDGESITTGRVAFKVNGKVLRDTNNKVIYAEVTSGTVTINYPDTDNWNENTQIQAVYMGTNTNPKAESDIVTPTITTPETEEPEFSVSDATTAGSEVTITVTTKNLDNGKVVLKVNGKTVKASDGKLYAKVQGDSVVFTYAVPKTLKAGDYAIKAVYTSGTTKLEADAKLTVE